jgi:hypothetical protein
LEIQPERAGTKVGTAPESLVSVAPASSNLGSSNMATYLSTKFDSNIGTEEENVEEMTAYAKYVPSPTSYKRPV